MSIRTPHLFHLGKKTPPPTLWSLQPHSAKKHDLLVDYLLRYFDTTYPRGGDRLRLTIVDGFAGPGEYEGGEEGSPLRFLQAVQEAELKLGENSKKSVDIETRFFFVEEREDRYRHLCDLLNKKREELGKHYVRCTALHGRFESHLEGIIREIRQHNPRVPRALFFLDQCGYTDVSINTVYNILRLGEHVEVIWTVACQPLLAFAGNSGVSQLGLTAKDVQHIQAVGGESADLYAKEHLLAKHIWKKSGARYYSPFIFPPDGGGFTMQIIHLTHHDIARSKMLESGQARMETLGHTGVRGVGVIGHNPTKSIRPEHFQMSWLSSPEMKESSEPLVGSIFDDLRSRSSDGILVGDYISEVANGTTETEPQMLEHIRKTGFRLLNKDGKLRRQGVKPSKTDVIDTTQRPLLF